MSGGNSKVGQSGGPRSSGNTRYTRRTKSAESKDKAQAERAKDLRAALIERFRDRLTGGEMPA